MGRHSPVTLLDTPTKVAPQTLQSEKKRCNQETDAGSVVVKPPKKPKHKSQQTTFSIEQLQTMPITQLVEFFSVFSSSHLKKRFSYACALVPGCGQTYTSFISMDEVEMSIKSHLIEHIESLKNNTETYASFRATAVNYAEPKSAAENEKVKIQQTMKPHKEPSMEENKVANVGESKCHFYKISEEVNFMESENNDGQARVDELRETLNLEINKEVLDVKVLENHNNYKKVKVDNVNKESASSSNRVPVNLQSKEKLMLVKNNSVCVRNPLSITESASKSENAEENKVHSFCLASTEKRGRSSGFDETMDEVPSFATVINSTQIQFNDIAQTQNNNKEADIENFSELRQDTKLQSTATAIKRLERDDLNKAANHAEPKSTVINKSSNKKTLMEPKNNRPLRSKRLKRLKPINDQTADIDLDDDGSLLKGPKSADKKKNNRCYCIFCREQQSQFSRHLRLKHKTNEHVKMYINATDKQLKRAILDYFRNVGFSELEKITETIRPIKATRKGVQTEKVRCQFCGARFSKETLKRHEVGCKVIHEMLSETFKIYVK